MLISIIVCYYFGKNSTEVNAKAKKKVGMKLRFGWEQRFVQTE